MQANGYSLPANEAPNRSLTRSGKGRGSGEKAKPSNRVRLNGNIVRRNPGKRIALSQGGGGARSYFSGTRHS